MRSRLFLWALSGVCLLALAACATTQQSFTPLKPGVAARRADADVLVFQGSDHPSRPYEKVAILDVHLEVTTFMRFGLSEAMPELKRQARLAGADAIIDIQENKSRVLETAVYHVRATGLRFTD